MIPWPARLAVVVALALSGVVPVSAAPPQTQDPEELEPGSRGVALTAITGDRIEEIPLQYVGVQRDALGPGIDLHLVQLEGPIAERVGVAAGMSGSPVYFDGKLLGALAYRLGALPVAPIAGVTAFEDMLRAEGGRTGGPAAGAGAGTAGFAAPIATPVQIAGFTGVVREWAGPQLEQLGFLPVGGGGQAEPGAAGGGALRPGSPVGVELVRGDLTIAATGTVTHVDGDRVFAFGHPFLGSGPIEMPMVSASVVHTLADLAGSIKLANVGEELGAVLEDRLTAIVGRTGRKARMVPVDLRVRGASYGSQAFHFEVARSSALTPLLAAISIANALTGNTGYQSEVTMIASGKIRLAGQSELPIEMAAAGQGGTDPVVGIAVGFQQVLASIWSNPFLDVDVEAVDLDVSVAPGVRAYAVEDVHYDRRPLRPGQPLRITCVLRRYRGVSRAETIELTLPEELPRQGRLALVVGAPDYVDRALGQPFARRLRTAPDLPSVLRILADLRSPHRLTAAVVVRNGGVVSRGVAYDDLPPTAARLLAGQVVRGADSQTSRSGLSRAEMPLDGPIQGGLVVPLDVDADLESDAAAGLPDDPE